jgi:hypothetical protein
MKDLQILWWAGVTLWAAWSLSHIAERAKRIADALEALCAMAERGRQ